eukprot:snap_masked-scaffold_5-processed-gene-9.8-mRNA-1 protein AED:0.00 eAED:0.00 QI:32/1/1/1/0.8/0.66/6/115/271
MLCILSPAKTIKQLENRDAKLSKTIFEAETTRLVKHIQKLSKLELKKTLKVSGKLLDLNHQRFKKFFEGDEDVFQAGSGFDGAAFRGLGFRSLSNEDQLKINENLIILSAVYGVIRPLDIIKPYRLDVADKINLQEGNLYQFWKENVTQYIKRTMEKANKTVFMNLASLEYSKMVDLGALREAGISVLDCVFQGKSRISSFKMKYYRGSLARILCTQGILNLEDLQKIQRKVDIDETTCFSFVSLAKNDTQAIFKVEDIESTAERPKKRRK